MASVPCPQTRPEMALVPCHTTYGCLGCRKHSLAHRTCSPVRKMGICLVELESKTATVLLGVSLKEECQNLLHEGVGVNQGGPCQVGVQ